MSNACGTSNLPTSNFTTADAGKTSGTAQGNMAQGSQVSINGSTDLSQTIVGPDGAYVQSITYEHFTGIARSSVFYAYGKGPKGMGSGSLKITLVTSANQSHDLNLTSSSLECHDDRFQDDTNVVSISWAPA
jgi:hypothetical protein